MGVSKGRRKAEQWKFPRGVFFPFFVRGPPLRKSYVPLPWAFSTVSKGRREAEQWKFPRGGIFPFFCKGTLFAKKLCSLALGIFHCVKREGGSGAVEIP